MNKAIFSPYVRVAMHSTLTAPFLINTRIILDYEIILVAGGECKITIGETPYICRKNDVVFIPPGIPHKFECINDSDFVQPHIHFDLLYSPESEDRFVSFKAKENMTKSELSLIHEDVLKDANIPYVFTPYDIKKFQKIFFEAIRLFQEKSCNYELLCKAKILELTDCVLSQFCGGSIADTDGELSTIVAAKNYIDSNFLSVITLDFLSNQFYMNKYTMMRKFKSLYKQNIISYYRQKRIEYAKDMLISTSVSISSLAEKMNFTDIYSFSRFFKACTGLSPREYRKNS
ncbi:MAG: AraC family transcriptional regulator [Clostridia bacterium]|nr:AraC family transcriptional regulator [Clostridia bacterium]